MVDVFEFDVRELLVLEAAARQADDVARLEAAIADGGVVVAGSKGQPRVAGAVAEVRQSRLALTRLLGQLALPDESADAESDKPRSERSLRAQKAAQARWASQAKRERGKGAGRGASTA